MTIRFRRGTGADDRAVHAVFLEAVNEIDRRIGSPDAFEPGDAAAVEANWGRLRSLFEHLAATADQYWIAEEDGRAVGYGRSIVRDGLRELTELFVLPGRQGSGVGRELLARAFPAEGARHRAIIATIELSALSRYLRTGVAAGSPIAYLSRSPAPAALITDEGGAGVTALDVETATSSPAVIEALAAIDRAVLGHRRDVDHEWLLGGRQGLLYRRGGRVVGYGYVGASSGPFAVLDPSDLPAVLRDAESRAADIGLDEFGVWLPLVNGSLAADLLARGYRIDPFLAILLSDAPIEGLDRYLVTGPPFFL